MEALSRHCCPATSSQLIAALHCYQHGKLFIGLHNWWWMNKYGLNLMWIHKHTIKFSLRLDELYPPSMLLRGVRVSRSTLSRCICSMALRIFFWSSGSVTPIYKEKESWFINVNNISWDWCARVCENKIKIHIYFCLNITVIDIIDIFYILSVLLIFKYCIITELLNIIATQWPSIQSNLT